MTSSFTSPLIVRVEPRERSGRGIYTVMQPFIYLVGDMESDVVIMVDAGFETDLASIPRLARLFISPSGLHAKASVLHDALYRRKAGVSSGCEYLVERHHADDVYNEAMQVSNVPRWRRRVIYAVVRAFGWIAYNRN